MRYLVRTSVIRVIGTIWMPSVTAAQTYTLSAYDVENVKGYGEAYDAPGINRTSVEQWLIRHAGDFSGITDFEASIEDGDDTVDIPWADEESEFTYGDCIFQAED
jgi:hypothetical protein